MTEQWPDERLFDAWYLHDEWAPESVAWPEAMSELTTREKELWGYLMAKRAIFAAMEGARLIYRGDAIVWESSRDCSYQIVGDLDVAWEGRSPIFEVKAFLPAYRLKAMRGAAAQGLDFPQYQDYLNEQNRTGRPFYVLWVWAEPPVNGGGPRVVALGERIDLLAWPAHAESLNRLRNVKGAKMVYWRVDSLRTLAELAQDVHIWSGSPFQEALL